MEQNNQKPRRNFTREQKYEIIKDIERCSSIRSGLEKYNIASSMYYIELRTEERKLKQLPRQKAEGNSSKRGR
jgi:hypothetical protein